LSTSSENPTVIVRRQGRIGRITLNRPKALNAIDLPMIQSIAAALDDWREDPLVHAVVIEGEGGRAFCAGGDIRQVRADSMAGDHAAIERFFTAEYALNLAIARYPKPYVALIDGFCMGGGIGLSVHGPVRVASEAAVFAMPETAIALFPDVGATFALPRLRGDWGIYLALTGARVGGADAVWLGLATHYMPRAHLAGLADAIAQDGLAALADATLPAPPAELAGREIGAFGLDSVAAIIARLESDGSDFARDTLATLRQVSPSAVLWTFEIVRAGAARTLEQCLAAELALTRHATRHPDFLEGVRAMVVDKDRAPRWSPARIEDVDPRAISALFTDG
jgi:enoyl-CoA hydratase